MNARTVTCSLSLVAGVAAFAAPAGADTGREAFRAIYKEIVEIDSSPTNGSCTKVVDAAQKRLKAAGYADAATSR